MLSLQALQFQTSELSSWLDCIIEAILGTTELDSFNHYDFEEIPKTSLKHLLFAFQFVLSNIDGQQALIFLEGLGSSEYQLNQIRDR